MILTLRWILTAILIIGFSIKSELHCLQLSVRRKCEEVIEFVYCFCFVALDDITWRIFSLQIRQLCRCRPWPRFFHQRPQVGWTCRLEKLTKVIGSGKFCFPSKLIVLRRHFSISRKQQSRMSSSTPQIWAEYAPSYYFLFTEDSRASSERSNAFAEIWNTKWLKSLLALRWNISVSIESWPATFRTSTRR